jgi:hypothetical protein
VAHENGLVVVIDTELDDHLRAEGDARELTRAVQDLRKQVGLEFDDIIDLWLDGPPDVLLPIAPYVDQIARDTLAERVHREPVPDGAPSSVQETSGGRVSIALRNRDA